MKFYTQLLRIALCLCFVPTLAQEAQNTLADQFTDVFDKSNRYEDYKVIKIFKLNNLRKSVNDSIALIEKNLSDAQGTIDQQAGEISTLTANVTNLQTELATSKSKEDGIQFFGSLMKKSTYKTIMWSVIGFLLLLALFFFTRFRNSNAITKVSNLRLSEIEAEFEAHRQRTLEREQQLRRKLQDEINKNKKAP
ncbi:tRNA (guanine-N1)-methyltransferase [Aureisphaera galaxeae]|uniref:tRNA (guanine-N1)-methyltransferase n=1 Tax=Aureisphaera galaxeae TaxID=1538023 RepID=UPI00234FB663|nr:tRNA (guanine-N1)-methyltransferase [Aureisphaera galaxeae]MDC8003798.1 tRNA (guanine-N1)-methyltransferase [Aureisphaera galaxeae]